MPFVCVSLCPPRSWMRPLGGQKCVIPHHTMPCHAMGQPYLLTSPPLLPYCFLYYFYSSFFLMHVVHIFIFLRSPLSPLDSIDPPPHRCSQQSGRKTLIHVTAGMTEHRRGSYSLHSHSTPFSLSLSLFHQPARVISVRSLALGHFGSKTLCPREQ